LGAGQALRENAMNRRGFVCGLCVAAAAQLVVARTLHGQAAVQSAGPADAALIDDLVAANRILFHQGVVDGFGHVSVRHDNDAARFPLARNMAPALVAPEDIMEFTLDGAAVAPRGRAVYLERFIHGEIYRARPDVKS